MNRCGQSFFTMQRQYLECKAQTNLLLGLGFVVGGAVDDFVLDFDLMESMYFEAYDWMSLARDASRVRELL